MKRRDLLKNITLTSVGIGIATTGVTAKPAVESTASLPEELVQKGKKKKFKPTPGRTPEEAAREEKLMSETFFTPHEMATITILCDIILPAETNSPGALQVGVPDFIEFIVKDIPDNQLPLRGGLKWLDNQALKRFSKKFKDCNKNEQIQIVEDIAYPDDVKPEFSQGAAFFTRMRDLTMTGFYTTEAGFKDLGYVGNQPNLWRGVPEDVLKQYGLTGNE